MYTCVQHTHAYDQINIMQHIIQKKLYVTNKNENDIIILFLPMEMNSKLTLM